MGDILSKLGQVCDKIGVTERAHTIEEQIDLITEALDATPASTNIAEALDDLSEVAQNINNEEVYVDKTITENGEYLPAYDEATAYSKVTVNVAPYFETPIMLTYGKYVGGEYPGAPVSLDNKSFSFFLTAPDANGNLNDIVHCSVTGDGEYVNQITFAIKDVNKIILSDYGMHHCLTFKAGNNFTGFYTKAGGQVTSSGATIENGKWYNALIEGSPSGGYTITVETNDDIGFKYADEYD